ncbi:hypothetical protein CEXT_323431 [Caerostris extrusa]|uniref:Uncharacterized protein n=1 Tax=Caerostris extrusa TaxID=172846 RepID=A0AAV4SD74_CAEEX|nr:hypothetical protein CEXT_323431 [Caerostris extrusa]
MLLPFALLVCLLASPSLSEFHLRRTYTERDLRRYLFEDYDKLVRPAANQKITLLYRSLSQRSKSRNWTEKNKC